jgi:hypothetical protein
MGLRRERGRGREGGKQAGIRRNMIILNLCKVIFVEGLSHVPSVCTRGSSADTPRIQDAARQPQLGAPQRC